MGLGLLGRGLGDAIFLAEHGAELIVTDIRDEKTLAPSLAKLKKYNNIRYTLGQHNLEDFRNRDCILKAAGVPLDSPYIAEARKRGIPVEMDASLFVKLMPEGATVIGVTGTRGKSTTAELIYGILTAAKRRVFLSGVVHTATLPLLTKVRTGDIVVLELDSWQLQGFHDAKISPQIAVFTTFLDDHLVYYKGDKKRYLEDKTAIFRYQKKSDVLIAGEQASPFVSSPNSVVARSTDIPKEWKVRLLGEHNRQNIACALAAARALGVSDLVIKEVVERFKSVSGRLEYLRTIRGIKIYNDNNATTPDATIAALKALSGICRSQTPTAAVGVWLLQKPRVVLIIGGTDKGLDISKLVAEIPKHCKAVVMLKESGTEKIKGSVRGIEKETLKECVEEAMRTAKKGDIILFSPALASFGRWFKNEYDRGEQFVKIVDKIK